MNLKQAKELVRSRLSDKRYEHTLNVKKMAVKLAKIYGEDEERAALAALLHDSAKETDGVVAAVQVYAGRYAESSMPRAAKSARPRCGTACAPPFWPAPSGV